MKNKFKSLFAIAASLFVIVSCSAPDEYLEKIGNADNEPKSNAGESLEHPTDEDAEGYYIPYKYWYSGVLDDNNKFSGEIWSFEAKGGQEYAVYLFEESNAFYAFEGAKITSFSSSYLKCCEQKYKYSNNVNLYDRPAIVTPEKDGTYYIKVTGSSSSTSEYSRTGKYDICVCKGRDGESFVELTLEGVAGDAWVEGELKFNIKDGWYDYENGTTSDWVDYDCYMLEVNVGDKVVLYGMDKTNSTYTAKTSFNAIYWNGTEFKSVFNEGYEYSNNDALVEGYPFTVPNDIALENGEIKKHIYWYVQPDLEEGATSVTVDGENIGTYQVAAKINEEFVEIETYALLCAYQYQLIVDDVKKLAVGAVFNPFEFAGLKKWDGTFVDSNDENLRIYWGDGFEKLNKYVYLICTEETTHTYMEFSYPIDGETYYFSKYLNIIAKDQREPKLSIEIVDENLLCVGNYATARLMADGEDKTSSGVWTWYNPNAESPTITNCEEKGVIPCFAEGSLYIIVQDGISGDIVYKEVSVKAASENPYKFTLSNGDAKLLESNTFSLSKDNTDITSSVINWTMSANNYVDFDSETKTAIFYRAGIDYTLTATLSDGTKVFTGGTVKDKANLTVTPELATRLTSIYNIYGSTTISESPLGTEVEEYNITITGTYSNYTYTNLATWLKYATVPVNLDMSAASGITGLEATKTVSSETVGVLYGCKIKLISLPQGLLEIPPYSFKNITNGELILESITIPNSVTSIGNDAFCGADKLTTVNLPAGLTSIGDRAFNGTKKLSSITLPEGLVSIGMAGFYISGLTSVTIPSSVTDLGSAAFAGCASLESANFASGSSLTVLPTEAFSSCSKLKTVILPQNLVSIGDNCFGSKVADNYVPIQEIDLPSTLIEIGEYAFMYCKDIKEIEFPSGLLVINTSAFKGCTGIKNITLPASLTALNINAFASCTSLITVSFETNSSIVRIGGEFGSSVFSHCTALSSINLPDSITEIGSYTFYNCTSLETIVLPPNLTTIEQGIFKNCTKLNSVNIPSNVTWIRSNAFENCTSLTSIQIPEKVTVMNDSVFCNCPLSSIELPQALTYIGEKCFNGTAIEEVEIPVAVTTIGPNAFSNNSNLNAVYFDYNLSWSYSSYKTRADTTATVINVRYYDDNANYLKSTYANYYWHKDDRVKVLDYHSAYLTDDILIPVTKDTETTLRFYVSNTYNRYLIYFEEYHNPNDATAVYNKGSYNLTDGKFEIYSQGGVGLYSNNGTNETVEGFGTTDLYAPASNYSYYVNTGYHSIKILPQSSDISDGYVSLHITYLDYYQSSTSYSVGTINSTSSLSNYETLNITSGNTYAYSFGVYTGYVDKDYTIQFLDKETDTTSNTGASGTLLTNSVDAIFFIVNGDGTQWWYGDSIFANTFTATKSGTYIMYIWTAKPPTLYQDSGTVGFRIYRH